MHSVRTVLLDLDGTLVDSAPTIADHLAAALAGAGAPVPDAAGLRRMVGPPFEESLPALGLTPDQMAATIAAYKASYYEVAAQITPVFPGIPQLLAQLRAAGLRLAVATSKPEVAATKIVAGTGLAEHFALVGGSLPAEGRIGKAAVVGSVLARLAPAAGPVLMVGDRHHDVDGAAEHGVATIGVAWGYAEPGELSEAQKVVADPDELAALLTSDAAWS